MILFQWLCHSIKNFIAKFCRRMDFELLFFGENHHFLPQNFLQKHGSPNFHLNVAFMTVLLRKTINLLNFEKWEAVQVS